MRHSRISQFKRPTPQFGTNSDKDNTVKTASERPPNKPYCLNIKNCRFDVGVRDRNRAAHRNSEIAKPDRSAVSERFTNDIACLTLRGFTFEWKDGHVKRYGTGSLGAGGKGLPFARAVEADGWLYVSGQVAMDDGEITDGGIIAQSHKAIQNMIAILDEAGYGTGDIVRIGVWLDDPRDFWSFNKIFAEYFGEAPPARACVRSSMMVDCKVEIDCIAYRDDRKN